MHPKRAPPCPRRRSIFTIFSEADCGFLPMTVLVIGQFYVTDAKMSFRGTIPAGRQLAMKPRQTNSRRILVPYPMRYKCLVGNAQRIFQRLARNFTHGKSILADLRFRLKTEVLHHCLIDHQAPIGFIQRGPKTTSEKSEPVLAGSPMRTRGWSRSTLAIPWGPW
jgi:hypothetical protein